MIERIKDWVLNWFFDVPYEMNCEDCKELPWLFKRQAD